MDHHVVFVVLRAVSDAIEEYPRPVAVDGVPSSGPAAGPLPAWDCSSPGRFGCQKAGLSQLLLQLQAGPIRRAAALQGRLVVGVHPFQPVSLFQRREVRPAAVAVEEGGPRLGHHGVVGEMELVGEIGPSGQGPGSTPPFPGPLWRPRRRRPGRLTLQVV